MATPSVPTKAQCFFFSVPNDTSVDAVMDAFQVATGPGGLKYLQHHGGVRFMAAVSSMAVADRLVAQGHLMLGDVAVPLEPVGARLLHVSVYRLPPYVTEEAVVQALSMYGKVKGISYVTFRDRPDIMTGTRVVKVEMTKPIPNFISIQGHRVMVDYRGMRRVCSKCGQEGHIGPACKTPRCDRCAVFGHSTAGCTEPCQRCGHAHATVDCTQRKTYAAVTQSTAARPSCVQPQETATAPVVPPASEQRKDDPSPPVYPQDVPPLQGNPVAVDNSQLSDAGSLSSDADRLVVVEDDEVTPGQGHPPSSPTSPRVSATPNTLEQLSAKAASAGTPAGTPAGASSAVDTTMECDRQEVKRGFSSSSSGSDAPSSAVAKKKRLVCKDSSPGDSDLEGYSDLEF
ncbi:uncharacterized protein LOC121833043 [Ixodes scapularis]|uniref:uncharacterized protein LOC121833043 n=1 Tax=Ixodes scapularis TaxID=6945 RepID=UPI001C384B03|nr:uncharacterized protein LOC121833043 [Ixodes scapularis]